ncbi:transposase is4 [Holotrichia oblita]|uniref:Transposase is4 n=1 Tax=Holotrichia oblita TaxID=644536 RepID=A0ACB9T5P4_HOLOL|nr:transposase is4 [Holotrichia oblita]
MDDTHNTLVSNALGRDRFEHILTNLHCCDNDNLEKNDRFAKVRPLFNAINKRCLEIAPHVENHSIDEAMVRYFGRHPGKQYIKCKPIRYGYKLWVGSTSSGYVIFVDLYQGANSQMEKHSSLGFGPSIVLTYADVITSKINASYHLYFDNFFSTVPLLEELSRRKLKGTGTIRENRRAKCPLPKNKEFKKKSRGTYDRTTENNSL